MRSLPRGLRRLLEITEDERRATVTGMNLFFGALLGANIGSFTALPLDVYFSMVLITTGAVAGLLTIAVSRRPIFVWTTLLTYLGALACFLFLPALRPPQIDREIDRLVVTLATWLSFIVIIRLSPSREDPPGGKGVEKAFLE